MRSNSSLEIHEPRSDTEEAQEPASRRAELALGLGLLVASSLYRALVLWADNAWEVAGPGKLLLLSLAVAFVASIPYFVLVRGGVGPAPSGIAVAALVLAVMNWHRLAPTPWLWLGVALMLSWLVQRFAAAEAQRALLIIGIATLLVAPLAQVGLAHVQRSEPYPIGELAERRPAEATGLVEDVLVVIVDSYPTLTLAERWFGHDASAIGDRLTDRGFVVESSAWSPYTFTGLTVPSLLELQPIVEPGPKGGWGHRMSTYSIIRGDSLVAATLTSAGFEYTHIESGWHAGACGDVDVCLESTWIDEETWELLRPGIAATYMDDRLGSHAVANSKQVVDHLEGIKANFGDGERDFVFAHMLLPHAPVVVDSECAVVERAARTDEAAPFEARLSAQLACADTFIERIAELVGPSTAVIITGDHGTASLGQNSKPPVEWSDADIAERLGVFLAYRLPAGCTPPGDAVNLDVMRAIMSCAVNMELPERDGRFMIGANEPLIVDSDRMVRIRGGVEAGTISPP